VFEHYFTPALPEPTLLPTTPQKKTPIRHEPQPPHEGKLVGWMMEVMAVAWVSYINSSLVSAVFCITNGCFIGVFNLYALVGCSCTSIQLLKNFCVA